jgi:DnaK suppressor protein
MASNTIDLAYVRQKLLDMSRRNKTLAEQVDDAAKPVVLDQSSVGRLSRMDALQGQAMAQANVDRQLALGQAIKKALVRIERNEYGRCLRCDDFIADARLDINPVAEHCIACAQLNERQ